MLAQFNIAVSSRSLQQTCARMPLPVRCSFNFTESQRVKQPTQGRRNRSIEKRQEQELRVLVRGLCAFTGKQLQAVAHLLSSDHIKQIKIAKDIPPTNQGRRRQEGLVAKLLRSELDGAALDRLEAAVGMVQRSNVAYADAGVEQQLQLWLEGLLGNDQVRLRGWRCSAAAGGGAGHRYHQRQCTRNVVVTWSRVQFPEGEKPPCSMHSEVGKWLAQLMSMLGPRCFAACAQCCLLPCAGGC
eukprot:GHRQ01014129.1.p1 GENE.GHRQ01014129.1~~GHRQ01014129.1.p1  ORF type:complete len:242 (+),score=65.40 GHRQ01014129.1:918-1643(+)